jgi:hypothetical protein
VTRSLFIAFVVAFAGCGSHQDRRSVVHSHDCFAAWNSRGNEANRADLAAHGFSFRVGSVERGMVFGDPARGGKAHEGELCGYLFHSSARFVSYTGDWRGDVLLWTNSQSARGRWTPTQQRTQHDDVRVLSDGRIAPR